MRDETAVLDLRFPRRAEAASAARRALASLNGDLHLLSQARLADVQLLASELVTNAVRYGAGQAVAMRVAASPRTLRVEIMDSGAGFDPRQLGGPSFERPGGWGLRIVEIVSHRWGVDATQGQGCVWFEVDRPQSETAVELSGEAPPPL